MQEIGKDKVYSRTRHLYHLTAIESRSDAGLENKHNKPWKTRMHGTIVDHIISHYSELVDPTVAQHVSHDGRLPITSLSQLPLSPFYGRLLFLYHENLRESSISLVHL